MSQTILDALAPLQTRIEKAESEAAKWEAVAKGLLLYVKHKHSCLHPTRCTCGLSNLTELFPVKTK